MNKKLIYILLTAIFISAIIVGIILIANNNRSESNEKLTSGKKIYDIVNSSASYVADPTLPEVALNGEGRAIIRAVVRNVEDATFLPKTEKYNNPYTPCTPVKIEIKEILYGTVVETDTVYMGGGDISLQDYSKTLDEVDIERLGISNLSQEEREINYIRFLTEHSVELENGKEYIMIIADIGNGLYKIVDEGSGIYTIDDNEDNNNSNDNNESNSANGVDSITNASSQKTTTISDLVNTAEKVAK